MPVASMGGAKNSALGPSLRFADARVQALLHTLVLFVFLPRGFSNHDLRDILRRCSASRPAN